MKRNKSILLISALASLLYACGDDSVGPDLSALPQSGSNTLFVNADVNGSDAGGGLFTTDFRVSLQDTLQAAVIDAAVTIFNPAVGSVALTHNPLNPGTYEFTRPAYTSGWYTLRVVRGTDSVTNASVLAPDIHTITFPTPADTLSISQGFTVTWTRTSIAEVVTLETDDFGPTLSASIGDTDDGTFDVPASGQIRPDMRVRLWRKNSVTITTGLAGSTFDAEIRNSMEPIVVL